jgi:hypothetical protein
MIVIKIMSSDLVQILAFPEDAAAYLFNASNLSPAALRVSVFLAK